ncbi:Glutamine amidotransferase, class-II (plasmid) [Pseudorhizobium banfieldiae]|uniref:Glutamine amidotransferase, class-II n=1 Tax=Pseudorhizobium banfieldiae TaxID=1125847 RepID=L0NNL7_9HYPH|nr:class II glutamine amidotransferase [Pseudorhizobium banfieldiae]CAD6630960.1 class II glutamine amidotransferase [arsenite-oxidising bacterium NT-25]CCF22132.1 Glutamine amidotransferase, class-II [Pseudorhizobium banfieldiae]
MCELLGMSSNQRATTRLSLTKLAAHSAPPTSIKDGWGVGYYEGDDVRLVKGVEPASESDWVRFVENQDIRSALVMAHIRKATMGELAYRNAQPFVRELAGRVHMFAHNGWLPDIRSAPQLSSGRFTPVGETDSEQAFCALLQRMSGVWRSASVIPPLEQRLSVIAEFAAELRTLGPANFLYSDGDTLFAHGDRRKQEASGRAIPPGLVFLERRCGRNGIAFEASGVSVANNDQFITLIASVPLSDDPWQALSEGEMIAIRNGKVTARHSGLPDL